MFIWSGLRPSPGMACNRARIGPERARTRRTRHSTRKTRNERTRGFEKMSEAPRGMERQRDWLKLIRLTTWDRPIWIRRWAGAIWTESPYPWTVPANGSGSGPAKLVRPGPVRPGPVGLGPPPLQTRSRPGTIPSQPGCMAGSGGNAPKESALVHMNTILAEQGNNGYDCYCLML